MEAIKRAGLSFLDRYTILGYGKEDNVFSDTVENVKEGVTDVVDKVKEGNVIGAAVDTADAVVRHHPSTSSAAKIGDAEDAFAHDLVGKNVENLTGIPAPLTAIGVGAIMPGAGEVRQLSRSLKGLSRLPDGRIQSIRAMQRGGLSILTKGQEYVQDMVEGLSGQMKAQGTFRATRMVGRVGKQNQHRVKKAGVQTPLNKNDFYEGGTAERKKFLDKLAPSPEAHHIFELDTAQGIFEGANFKEAKEVADRLSNYRNLPVKFGNQKGNAAWMSKANHQDPESGMHKFMRDNGLVSENYKLPKNPTIEDRVKLAERLVDDMASTGYFDEVTWRALGARSLKDMQQQRMSPAP